jgi:hypothetical protein
MASTLFDTHFIVGESSLDEIPDLWLAEYIIAKNTGNKMKMSIIKKLTGLGDTELQVLHEERKGT